MKNGFGWFFLVWGGINIIRGFILLGEGADNAGGILVFGSLFLMLGIWMISPSKANITTQDTGKQNERNYGGKELSKEEIPSRIDSNVDMRTVAMRATLMNRIEEEFEAAIRETLRDAKESDPLVMSLAVQVIITNMSKELKLIDYGKTDMDKEDVDVIIDEVTTRITRKYMKCSDKSSIQGQVQGERKDTRSLIECSQLLMNMSNGISNFQELEERIFILKNSLPFANEFNSEEAGNALLDVFISLFEGLNGSLDSKELNKAIDCLNLIEGFEIDDDVKESFISIKSKLEEMAEISLMRAAAIRKLNDVMRASSIDSEPENFYEQALPFARKVLVDGYRRIAKERSISPTFKISDERIIDIYMKVGTAFNEAAKQRGERIPAKYLNTIILHFFQINEINNGIFFEEQLKYEINKYLNEGLREDYMKDLNIFS